MDNLVGATFEDLRCITDIGDKIAKSISDYFLENIDLIDELKSLGLNMDYLGGNTESNKNFEGLHFVLTGTLENLTRNEAKKLIEDAGGDVTSSVSSQTAAVITGIKPGSKYDKAIKLSIPIWSEEELMNKLGGM